MFPREWRSHEGVRTGLIADIHGNLQALEAVLHRLNGDRVDQLVCLGDVAALGPQPAAVISRLRDLQCACVLGNADAWLLPDPPLAAVSATTIPVAELTRWCAEKLSAADADFLEDMPATIEIPLGSGLTLLAFHASPISLDDVIAATTPAAELDAMLSGRSTDVFAGGHTHVQLLRRFNQAHIVNPGSVGLPGVGPGDPDLSVNERVDWAEYAVIDVSESGVTVELHRLRLDVPRMVATAAASGMPHVDWWASKWHAG
ncbi:MAG: hypothetical protein QOF01_1223 [Thermomicrobiales bacterium]|nr:hypothetical protein [Thermomicrobiales bacterium]